MYRHVPIYWDAAERVPPALSSLFLKFVAVPSDLVQNFSPALSGASPYREETVAECFNSIEPQLALRKALQ